MLALTASPFAGQQTGVALARNTTISTANGDALSRLNPVLAERASATPDASIVVHAYVMAGTDLSAYMPDALQRRWVSPDGITISTGTVRARNLTKLASVPGVISVDPMTGAFSPASMPTSELQAAPMPDAELRASMTAQIQSGERSNTQVGAIEAEPEGWYDVLNTHHSSEAWDLGYTGAGVKVMANDSGIDFAHPDLVGTWATVDDPASPYYGWPEQFDAFSMFLHARDVILGEANIANGAGHYADTSTVVTESDNSYQPLDSASPMTTPSPARASAANIISAPIPIRLYAPTISSQQVPSREIAPVNARRSWLSMRTTLASMTRSTSTSTSTTTSPTRSQ